MLHYLLVYILLVIKLCELEQCSVCTQSYLEHLILKGDFHLFQIIKNRSSESIDGGIIVRKYSQQYPIGTPLKILVYPFFFYHLQVFNTLNQSTLLWFTLNDLEHKPTHYWWASTSTFDGIKLRTLLDTSKVSFDVNLMHFWYSLDAINHLMIRFIWKIWN